MSRNLETVNAYLDGFRKNDHEQILACLTDDVEWTVFGAFHVDLLPDWVGFCLMAIGISILAFRECGRPNAREGRSRLRFPIWTSRYRTRRPLDGGSLDDPPSSARRERLQLSSAGSRP